MGKKKEKKTYGESDLMEFSLSEAADVHKETTGGGWLKFEDGDEFIVKIVSDTVQRRKSNFAKEGEERYEYVFEVEVNKESMKWSISANSGHADKLMKFLAEKHRKFRVTRDGTGRKTTYVIKPLK